MKIISGLLAGLVLSATSVLADEPVSPEAAVTRLFEGMLAGNGAIISSLVAPGARLDRLQPDGSLKHGEFTSWIAWVDQQQPGDADEQIFAVKTLQRSAELATVWAPFQLHYKGEFVGCGVNQFTLARSKDGWRIVYAIDMPYKGDCAAFRASLE